MIHTIRIVVTAAVRSITFVFTLNLTLVNEKVFDELVGGKLLFPFENCLSFDKSFEFLLFEWSFPFYLPVLIMAFYKQVYHEKYLEPLYTPFP